VCQVIGVIGNGVGPSQAEKIGVCKFGKSLGSSGTELAQAKLRKLAYATFQVIGDIRNSVPGSIGKLAIDEGDSGIRGQCQDTGLLG